MDVQLVAVILMIAFAVLYLGRASWRTWSGGKSGCGGGCSCAKSPSATEKVDGAATFIPVEQLSLRRRPAPPA